jgi:dipeptide transport system substrate-binding protein
MLARPLAALLAVFFAASAQGKTLVYCSEGSPENFNPMINTTGTSFDAARPVVQTLIGFKPGTADLAPNLAESWEVSPDGLAFTLHLRRGVAWQSSARFTPTREFDADDVLFSFNRQWKEDSPFHKVSGGDYAQFADQNFPELLSAIDKLDDHTVRFTLTRPNAIFLHNLGSSSTSIQSAEYADALMKAGRPELIDQEPIGTGPFQFVSYQRDSTIRYKAFPGYWGGRRKLDALVFSINKDPAVRLAKLRANECQIAAYPSFADLPSVRADPELQLAQVQGMNIAYLALNVSKPPFDDRRVRQAMNMAIDKQAILTAVYQGAAVPAKNLIPPTLWAWNADVQDWPHDPERARALLAEAGHPDGLDIDLWAMPVQRPYNPDPRRVAELMQSDLAKVGVRARIVSFEWGEYRKRAAAGQGQAVELGWTANGDPDDFFNSLATCATARPDSGSATKWCNHDFDALIARAQTVLDEGERKRLYDQAQLIMHEEAPYFLIAHSLVFTPMRKNVEGFVMSPIGELTFDDVDLK